MVYTITFNPAIDYTIQIDNILPGEVNRASKESIHYGGKGINVSLVLNELGIENIAYGFIAGFTGEEIERGLNKHGVKTEFIKIKKGISRINIKLKSVQETEINGQGPDIPKNAADELFRKLDSLCKNDILILAGSIPRTLSPDIYEQIMKRLQNKGVNFIVDAEKELLTNTLKYHPFLVKPNDSELGAIFGKTLGNDGEIEFYAKKLQEYGAKNVLVSMGSKGAMLLTENGETQRIETIKGNTKVTVGSGDSMIAGFVAGWLKKHDYRYALELGAAAGTATAFSDSLGTYTEIMENLKKYKEYKTLSKSI